MMLMPAALICRTVSYDLVDLVALVDVGQHALVGRLDAERQPVEAGALSLSSMPSFTVSTRA